MSKSNGNVVKRKGKRAQVGHNKKSANMVEDTFSVTDAMDMLAKANEKGDRPLAKKLRRQLRAHGHMGGLRSEA